MKRFVLILLAVMMCLGISTTVSATLAWTVAEEEEKEQEAERESVGQIMDHVLQTKPDINEIVAWFTNSIIGRERYFPSYDDVVWDFMRSAYQWMFRLHPGADWFNTMIYSWGVVKWGGWEKGGPQEERAEKEAITPEHALGFWSWRQELLRQATGIMNDPTEVVEFYKRHKNTIVMLNGFHKGRVLKRAHVLLSVVQGTHEQCPYLTVVWYSKIRDNVHYHWYKWTESQYQDRGFWVRQEFGEVIEWFYFLERRRAVGGDDVIAAYEVILIDFIKTMGEE